MDNYKRLTFDDACTAASALRRLTRTPTGQRLSLRRSSSSSGSSTSSASSIASSSLDDEHTPSSCASRNTPGDDCALYKFIVWAAVKRNACHKMTEQQRRECPLINCRKQFPNHELMLRHLYTCEHLAGGAYWCYDCGRPEKLNDAKCRRCLGHPSKRRKLMSMAKRVFSSLGNRPKSGSPLTTLASSLSAEEEPPSYDSVFTPVYTELPSNEIHEIDSKEVSLPTIPECEPGSDPAAMFLMLQPAYDTGHDPQIKTDPQPPDLEADFINWEPSPSPSAVVPDILLRPALGRPSDKPSLQLHTRGLDHYRPQAKRRSKALAPSSSIRSTSSTESADSTSSAESYDISPMSGWSGGWAKGAGLTSVLTSPCDDLVTAEDAFPSVGGLASSSLKPVEFSSSELGNLVANSFLSELPAEVTGVGVPHPEGIFQDLGNLEHAEFSFEPTVPLSLAIGPDIALTSGVGSVPQQPFSPAPQLAGSELINARSLVEAAQDTLRVHIAESVAKLGELGNNAIAREFCGMHPASIAHAGLETMVEMLEGRPATSPTNLLCFLHLIFSLSVMIHEQDIESRCSGLFKQALLYGNWFADLDRSWYIEAVYSLWKPYHVSDADIIALLREAPGGNTWTRGSSVHGKGKAPERTLEGPRSDALVFVAQYFLDELDALAVRDVSQPEIQASGLCVHHIKDVLRMDHDMPSPFSIAAKFLINHHFSAQFSGVPGFFSSVQNIAHQLDCGRISTVRRLELEMLQAGKIHLPVEIFFDGYIELVRQQMDLLYAVHGSTLSSRSVYHAYAIQLMKLLVSESGHGQPSPKDIVQERHLPDAIEGFIGSMSRVSGFDLDAMMDFGQAEDEAPAMLPTAGTSEWQPQPASGNSGSGSLAEEAIGDGDSHLAAVMPSAPRPSQLPPPPPPSPPPPPPPPSATPHLATAVTSNFNPSPTSADSAPASTASNSGPASIKVESNSCCEICGYRPKGDPRWFGGSMAKHKKLQHSEETKIYRCPYPGCTSQYSKRPDNLRQHQIEKGHFLEGQGSGRKRSRKREWTTEVE